MLKKIYLALALLAGLISPAHSAGTISFSLSQQLDSLGKPLSGCKLYIFQAGTTTPQIAYQDTALTLPVPGGTQLTCDAAGRLPQFFLADGLVKVRLTDKNGLNQAYPNGAAALDNLLVIGPSSGGGGGGGSVDPTTVMATGDIKARYGTGVLTGFVRANGRTIGSATSGATERANADCQALFEYLWNTDPNLVVSTGRGGSANADWVANKTITVPDWRNRAIAGLGDMGNTDAGRLTATYFGASGTTLGSAGGSQFHTLAISELPVLSPTFVGQSGSLTVVTDSSQIVVALSGISTQTIAGGSFPFAMLSTGASTFQLPSHGTFTPTGSITPFGGGGNMSIASPMMLATIYLKL